MQPLAFLIALATLGGAAMLSTSWRRRQLAVRRLHTHESAEPIAIGLDGASDGELGRWLSRAGYHGPRVVPLFFAITSGSALVGLLAGQIYAVTLSAALIDRVATVPGGAGDLLAEILRGGPWILFILGALGPMAIVRSKRRARVRAIEQDLPLALEMLATMADAGLGFDAALANIVRARGGNRPLTAEFVKFQFDMLAGMPRSQALRQLARRVHLPALSSFTSALVQAEQVGASIAETLQHQAADLRQRRREEALLRAQALPVKLVFPLVICFLPGVFLSTLAPVLYQMVQVANSVLRPGP